MTSTWHALYLTNSLHFSTWLRLSSLRGRHLRSSHRPSSTQVSSSPPSSSQPQPQELLEDQSDGTWCATVFRLVPLLELLTLSIQEALDSQLSFSTLSLSPDADRYPGTTGADWCQGRWHPANPSTRFSHLAPSSSSISPRLCYLYFPSLVSPSLSLYQLLVSTYARIQSPGVRRGRGFCGYNQGSYVTFFTEPSQKYQILSTFLTYLKPAQFWEHFENDSSSYEVWPNP